MSLHNLLLKQWHMVMKNIQQQVSVLQTQQQQRTNKVVELQAEEERVMGIIQDVHKKMQQVADCVGLTMSKHASFDLVENL